MKLNTKGLAEMVGVSSQAISNAKSRGALVTDDSGLYDTTDPVNLVWIEARQSGAALPGRKPNITSQESRVNKTELYQINKKIKFAEMRHKEITVERMQEKYFPAEFIEAQFLLYVETLGKNIIAMGKKKIPEIGKEILKAGEITPKHEADFLNAALMVMHKTKLQIMEGLK